MQLLHLEPAALRRGETGGPHFQHLLVGLELAEFCTALPALEHAEAMRRHGLALQGGQPREQGGLQRLVGVVKFVVGLVLRRRRVRTVGQGKGVAD